MYNGKNQRLLYTTLVEFLSCMACLMLEENKEIWCGVVDIFGGYPELLDGRRESKGQRAGENLDIEM